MLGDAPVSVALWAWGAAAIMQAWRQGLKGLTVFRPSDARRAVLQSHGHTGGHSVGTQTP
jgi:hypothetical protein